MNWNSIRDRKVLCINPTHLVVTCSFAQHTMFLDTHDKETLTHKCQCYNDWTVKGWDNYVLKDFPKTYIVRLNKCVMQLSNYCPVTTTCMSPTAQTFCTSNYFPVLTYQLTTSNLITAISAVSSPITTVRRSDALSIAAPKCSTLTGSCINNIITKSLHSAK